MPSPLPNPLLPLHEQADAELQPYDQTPIVSTFGQPELEYAAIRKSAGLMDLPQRGVLELSGKDRLAFLNNLLTNQTWSKETKTGLAPGQGVYAFFLNTKGRIVSDMNVLELGERTLLEMDGRLVEPIRAAFDKYLFTEQVKMTSQVGNLHELAIHGPRGLELINQFLESPLPELPPLGSASTRLMDVDVVIWRDDPAGVPGHYLLIPAASATEIWTALLDRFGGGLPTPITSAQLVPTTTPVRHPLRPLAGPPLTQPASRQAGQSSASTSTTRSSPPRLGNSAAPSASPKAVTSARKSSPACTRAARWPNNSSASASTTTPSPSPGRKSTMPIKTKSAPS